MKKIAPHIRNKQGSMLMLTLIVFMVILILGMTMITSMLYSQGENNMQINEQKAYYAAQSAVEAVKSYFLNPNSSTSTTPHDLIGSKGTYNLKDQGIDEDTTVELSISREKDDEYILITAKGICHGEESTVTARMLEEVKEGGSGGLYDSQVVFGSSNLQIDKDVTVTGNIYLDSLYGNYSGTINHLKMISAEDQKSTLYIKNKSSLQLAHNELTDVYIETEVPVHIEKNKAENMYIRCTGINTGWDAFTFLSNTVKGEAQLYLGQFLPNVNGNTIGGRFIFGFARDTLGWRWISNKKANEFYIKGVGELSSAGSVSVEQGGSIGNIYIDSNTKVSEGSGFKLKPTDWGLEYQSIDLSYLDLEEQRISTVISGLEEVENVLKNNTSWNKDIIIQNAVLIDEELKSGIPVKNPANSNFEEYYDPNQKVRWVFSKNKGWDEEIVGAGSSGSHNTKYYLDDNEETVFFISEATRLNMYVGEGRSIDNFYIYAPNTDFSFESNFQKFSGSIIAKSIKLYKGPKEIEFKSPEGIENTGEPSMSGESTSVGGSSGTSYTYYFKEYVD